MSKQKKTSKSEWEDYHAQRGMWMRWPLSPPNDERILWVRGTTLELAMRRFRKAFQVEPVYRKPDLGDCFEL